MAEQCEVCRFWQHKNEYGGFCRRNPPQIVVLAVHDPAHSSPEAHYPWTDKAGWCGEFQNGGSDGKPSADLDARAVEVWPKALEAWAQGRMSRDAAASIITQAIIAAEARGKLAGFSEGIEAAAEVARKEPKFKHGPAITRETFMRDISYAILALKKD